MGLALALGFLGLAFAGEECSAAFEQGAEQNTTLMGCLGGSPGKFGITFSPNGEWYTLTGNTSGLARYVGKQVTVEGKKHVSTRPPSSFEVVRIDKVFATPRPRLNPAFSNPSIWHSERSPAYGIAFAYPEGTSRFSDSELGVLQPGFVSGKNVTAIASFLIPPDVYPYKSFGGGTFAIFVNPAITNAGSCSEFGVSDPRFRSSHSVSGIQYTVMTMRGGAAGTVYSNRSFHTFQNGICYEVAFRLIEPEPGNYPDGCMIPMITEADEDKLIEPFLARVSFFPPTIALAKESNPHAAPRVTEFKASSETADDATNRGQITFSWSTRDADYVGLSYTCVPAPTGPGVVITEGGVQRDCENSKLRYSDLVPNRSPNGSANVLFGSFHLPDPISVSITVTPFSHGMPYPDSSKSVKIRIDPYNPFPEGVPAANGNIVITYSPNANAKGNYRQGSPLTIRWTDALARDPCVDLYLVQQDGSGRGSYRVQIGGRCFSPSRSGSYAWTIPDKYLGSGYRIFARTPGGTSSGLGPRFSIMR